MDNLTNEEIKEEIKEIEEIKEAEHIGAELRDFYGVFCAATIKELQNAIIEAGDTDEKAFYRKLLNLKLQTEQEKIVGERLV